MSALAIYVFHQSQAEDVELSEMSKIPNICIEMHRPHSYSKKTFNHLSLVL